MTPFSGEDVLEFIETVRAAGLSVGPHQIIAAHTLVLVDHGSADAEIGEIGNDGIGITCWTAAFTPSDTLRSHLAFGDNGNPGIWQL